MAEDKYSIWQMNKPKGRSPYATHLRRKGHNVEPNKKAVKNKKACRGKHGKPLEL